MTDKPVTDPSDASPQGLQWLKVLWWTVYGAPGTGPLDPKPVQPSDSAFTAHDLHHAATTMADTLNERCWTNGYRVNVQPADILAALDQLGMTLTPDPTNQARHAANTR